jgi:TonB-linked SusC/RagA family outer membrane protein
MKCLFYSTCRGWMLVLFAMAISSFAYSQRTVSGTVTDAESGEPLIGASILVVGTGSGSITDIDGNFEVNMPEGINQIEVSYTGYSTQTFDVTGQSNVQIQLKAGAVLEEVVVVGYGTQKSKEVTSAITSVKAEDFNNGNINNPTQLLQGKVAGLVVTTPNSDPNGDISLLLRGVSSLSGSTQPLIIIDGVLGADLKSIDPQDIATIDVLKDGSAAAIYGTRGTNGVVIITTKRGKEGKATVEYSGYVSSETVARSLDVLTADEYRAFMPVNPNESIDDLGSSTNWEDEITRNGISHFHGLSISGGNGSTTYRGSFNFRDIQGVAVNSGFDQVNLRLNLTQMALNDRLKFDLNLTNTNRNVNFISYGAFQNALIGNPTAPVFAEEGSALADRYDGYFQIPGSFEWENPLAQAEQTIDEALFRRFIGSLRAELTLVEGLKLAAFYSQQRNNDLYGRYEPKVSFAGDQVNGRGSRSTDSRLDEQFQTTLNYEKEFGKLDIGVLGGYEWLEFTSEGFRAENQNFITDVFDYNNLGAGLALADGQATMSSYKNQSRLIAFFGRVQASYDDTYLLTFSLRRDGSSKFGRDNKWEMFPAVSAGVRMRKFLGNVEFLDDLKIRAGYGVTGNVDVIPPYESLSRLRSADGLNFLLNGQWVQAVELASNPNPNLQWEEKAEFNVGVDFNMLNYRLNGSIDYYNRNTSNLLWRYNVPVPPNLFSSTFGNAGEIVSQGVELALNTIPVQAASGFTWSSDFNIAFNRAELVSLSNETFQLDNPFVNTGNAGSPGLEGVTTHRIEEGFLLGNFYGLVYEGIDEEGKWIFRDVDEDGDINLEADRDIIGNAYPDFTFGFNNTFSYKGFDLNVFIRGAYGNDVLNSKRMFYENEVLLPGNILASVEENASELNDVQRYSSFYIEDGSFIRLDNATMGYTFDVSGMNAISRLRVYVSGQNLALITNYSGVDPEQNLSGLEPGIDPRSYYPRTRVIMFGLNLGL